MTDTDAREPIAWMIQSVDRQGRAYTDISPVKPSDGMLATIRADFQDTVVTPLYARALDSRCGELLESLKGVIAVSDRATDEYDRAKKAIAAFEASHEK